MVPRWRVGTGLAVLGVLFVMPMRGQLILPKEGEPPPSFEVATIKPAAADAQGTAIEWMADGQRMVNVQLRLIIRNAFGAHSDAQLIGGPNALLDQRFDVQAKLDASDAAQLDAMSIDDQRHRRALMMQALLEDRFQMKTHVEIRELPVYALVAARRGPKVRPAPSAAPSPESRPSTGAQPPDLRDQLPYRPPHATAYMQVTSTAAEMSVSAGTMAQLAVMLTGQGEIGNRVVIDRTGLAGKYDWNLNWMPSQAGDASSTDSGAPGLFTALQEQLGLRLEPQKGPVQVIVIDHLEPLSPN